MFKKILKVIHFWLLSFHRTEYTERLALYKWHGPDSKLWWDHTENQFILSKYEVEDHKSILIYTRYRVVTDVNENDMLYKEEFGTFGFTPFNTCKLLDTIAKINQRELDMFILGLTVKHINFLKDIPCTKTKIPFKGLKFFNYYFYNTNLNREYPKFGYFNIKFSVGHTRYGWFHLESDE